MFLSFIRRSSKEKQNLKPMSNLAAIAIYHVYCDNNVLRRNFLQREMHF